MDKTEIEEEKETKALALNVILIIFGIMGFIRTLIGMGNPAIEYYTQLSNYFALISATIYTFYLLKIRKEREKSKVKENEEGNENKEKTRTNTTIPKWVSILKYSSTLSLLVTFLVVLFILLPIYGLKIFVWLFFLGSNLFYHTLCPILTFISFMFFEKHNIKGLRDNFRAIYFTIIYAAIFITLNILKVIEGPYPFLMVYRQPVYMSIIWFILIVGGAFGLSMLIMKIKNKQQNK